MTQKIVFAGAAKLKFAKYLFLKITKLKLNIWVLSRKVIFSIFLNTINNTLTFYLCN